MKLNVILSSSAVTFAHRPRHSAAAHAQSGSSAHTPYSLALKPEEEDDGAVVVDEEKGVYAGMSHAEDAKILVIVVRIFGTLQSRPPASHWMKGRLRYVSNYMIDHDTILRTLHNHPEFNITISQRKPSVIAFIRLWLHQQ